ncbi:MAG: SpoIIE family protein phosphatase [Spirochaetales bacterium]|nr:SpoIIE family protein phosphatase [Spirochaetales bacterium]
MIFRGIKNIFNSFFMLSADPSVILQDDGSLKKVNPSFTRTFRNTGLKVSGTPLTMFFSGEQGRDFEIKLKMARHKKISFSHEAQFISSDDEICWIQWSFVSHKWKKLFYGSGRDITLLKQQEEQLRVSYTAMESAANGIYLLDKNEVITWVNSSFLKISGFTRTGIVGKTPENLSSGVHGESFFNDMRETLSQGMVWIGEVVNRRPDGSLYTVEQTIAPVYSPLGELSYFVAIMQDISERKKAEKVLQEHLFLLQRDIDLAAKVQASLLPAALPQMEGFDISALAIPAQYVSGDLYDCFLQDDNKWFFAMADISGKGVPAAMLASSVKTLLRSGSMPYENPSLFLNEINGKLYNQLNNAEMFVTLCAVKFDPDDASLIYANAGHTQGIVIRGYENKIELLPPTGIPLGIMKEALYSETRTSLVPGDAFVLYSDGITEAHNEQWELFGMERLIEILKQTLLMNAEERIKLIVEAVSDFRKETALSDDISLVVFCAEPRMVQFSFVADILNLEKMNSIIRNSCSAYGQEFSYAIELSASELFTNIILHSHKDSEGIIRAKLTLAPDKVELDIYDSAVLYEADKPQDRTENLLNEGGHGLNIIRQLCDELTHSAIEPEGNHWHVVKRRKNESLTIAG